MRHRRWTSIYIVDEVVIRLVHFIVQFSNGHRWTCAFVGLSTCARTRIKDTVVHFVHFVNNRR